MAAASSSIPISSSLPLPSTIGFFEPDAMLQMLPEKPLRNTVILLTLNSVIVVGSWLSTFGASFANHSNNSCRCSDYRNRSSSLSHKFCFVC